MTASGHTTAKTPNTKNDPSGESAERDSPDGEMMTLEQALRTAQRLQREERFQPAEEIYQRILELLPEEPNALHFLGVMRHQQGRDAEALELIRQAILKIPNDAGPWINAGNIYLGQERFDEAIDSYKRASELDPSNVMVFNNLGLLHRRRNNPDLAQTVFLHALKLVPDAEYVIHNLARLLMDLGRYEEAIGYGLKLVTKKPDSPRARRLLATSHALLGNISAATAILEEWQVHDPGNPEAEHFLAGLGVRPTPRRASNAYVQTEFDEFAKSFDAKLESLGYQAPALVTDALLTVTGIRSHKPEDCTIHQIPNFAALDAGCGTGLCAAGLRTIAKVLDGVDLSRGMLEQARLRQIYDTLEQAELSDYLSLHPDRWDAIVSADTLCYFGGLEEVTQAARSALRPGGWFIFTTEALDEGRGDYLLQYHGRYQHSEKYLRAIINLADLNLISLKNEVLRMELNRPVNGWVVVAGRPIEKLEVTDER